MAEEREFVITRTVSTTFLDEGNNPVLGFEVFFLLPEFDEMHSVNVPNLQAPTVEAAINIILEDRRALAELGL